jgi:uncharacterized coiled-coil protein SlyX
MADINEDVLDRLEAEATVADAEAEELTIAVESNIEQKESRVEELESQVEQKESRVEELESQVEEKESEIEEMQDAINSMADRYAEELAEHNEILDKEDFLDKFEFEELQERFQSLAESSPAPAPNSGDPGAGFQSAETGEGGKEESGEGGKAEELSEVERDAAEAFRKRARRSGKEYWDDIADDVENKGE